MKKAALFFALIVLCGGMLYAQSYNTKSKRAIKNFDQAVELYQLKEYDEAELYLGKAIAADECFLEAYGLIAQIALESGQVEKAIVNYNKTLEIDPGGNPDGYRILAGLVLKTGDYERSLELLNTFFSFPPEKLNKIDLALRMKSNCLFALEAKKNPVSFEPENLGDSINSEYNEYWPCLSVDEQELMFTVMLPTDPLLEDSPRQEDFYFSKRKDQAWSKRKNAGLPLNTIDNEGAHTLTADGQMIFFTACNRRDGRGQCDIYTSIRFEGDWSPPVNLGSPVNSRYSEKHPTISADGRILYFISNKPGGKGSYDIYRSMWDGSTWSKPENLGDSVNTPGVEQSPFLHPDQRSLYFSSTYWPGMGEGDLFFTRQDTGKQWSTPLNLGYPINTFNNEIGLSVNARGDRAYFASDREGKNNTDIFTFELPVDVRPILVSYLSGRVYNSRNMRGLEAHIQLIDLETELVVNEFLSRTPEGSYLITLPTDRDYALNVTADGYLFYSDHFSFRGEYSQSDPKRMDIALDILVVGSSVILNNIFFESDSHLLLPESMVELNRVLTFMEENPVVAVEIAGYTDSTGSPEYNQELSGRRAEAVVAYLTTGGISASRLIAKGYGESSPLEKNDSEEGRAKNRRTELKIIDIR